jgi:hypothetical protein
MNWFLIGSTCRSIIDFSWVIGALAGVVLAAFLIIAIALTPPLREHGGAPPPPMGAMQKYGLWLPPFLIAALWLGGLWCVGGKLLSCYASLTASAASIVAAVVILPIAYIAAHHIARRSVP